MAEANSSSPYAFYAFYQLYRHFHKIPAVSLQTIDDRLYQGKGVKPEFAKCPLFVTWKKLSRQGHYQLRGCIGTFAECEIEQGLTRYALIAALQDSRFSPISEKELALLSCGTNLLSNFKTIYKKNNAAAASPDSLSKSSIFDWELGKHGIELKFRHPKTGARLSATFLPEVMPEQGWNQQETFENLVEKAGCWKYVTLVMDHWDEYFDEVIRYEGTKSQITWEEFESKLPMIT